MNTKLHTNNSMKRALLSAVLATGFGLTARAGLYVENFTDSGAIPIPQSGFSFGVEHPVSGIGTPVSAGGIELILTFNSFQDLNGNSSGIQGRLILNPGVSQEYATFFPTATYAGTGPQEIYDVTISGLTDPFFLQSPNSIWALNLWDNNQNTGGIENGLVSWTMDINTISTVPEPISYALALFGLVFIGAGARRFYLRRRRQAV